jgi:outer membrane protein OmpA-like peptidoglycan-associated protein
VERKVVIPLIMAFLFAFLLNWSSSSFAQAEISPLQFLKKQEINNKEKKGEIYLGRVMTLLYSSDKVDPDEGYHPLLLELTDVLKTPLRESYRLVLKGFSDRSGAVEANLSLSKKRAASLKRVLVRKYYMPEARITAEGFGVAEPVASNETPEDRHLNRRVEIHVYGDVSEAVRFMTK